MHFIVLISNKINQSVEIGGIIKNTIGFSMFQTNSPGVQQLNFYKYSEKKSVRLPLEIMPCFENQSHLDLFHVPERY